LMFLAVSFFFQSNRLEVYYQSYTRGRGRGHGFHLP
jgi:hypothetical protein